jgi:mannitol/fructose-specific phosphotransferase system IIA component (Ntr-type)
MTEKDDQNALLIFLLSIIENEEEKKILEQLFNSVKPEEIIEDFIEYKKLGKNND